MVASPTIFIENGEEYFMWNVKITMNASDISLQNGEVLKDRLNGEFQQVQQNGKQHGFEIYAVEQSDPMMLRTALAAIGVTCATTLGAMTAKKCYTSCCKE